MGSNEPVSEAPGPLERSRYERDELLAISRALSSERDIRKLLDLILDKSRRITGADAGSVYVLEAADADGNGQPDGLAFGDPARLPGGARDGMRMGVPGGQRRAILRGRFRPPVDLRPALGVRAGFQSAAAGPALPGRARRARRGQHRDQHGADPARHRVAVPHRGQQPPA